MIVTDVEPDGIVNEPDAVAVPPTTPAQFAPYVVAATGAVTATTGTVVLYVNTTDALVAAFPTESIAVADTVYPWPLVSSATVSGG